MMSEFVELETEVLGEEEEKMGSLNHSMVQGQITGILFADKRFRIMPELSLDMSALDLSQFGLKAKNELKPDISIYPNTLKGKARDVPRLSEIPLLAIEVISLNQTHDQLLTKFDGYFALGVKSCWLVMPMFKSIAVYSQPDKFRMFDMNDSEVIDEALDIKLSMQEIFANIFDW